MVGAAMKHRHPRVSLLKKLALSFEEAAAISGVGEGQLRNDARDGKLTAFRVTDGGGKYKISRQHLEQYMNNLAQPSQNAA